MFTGLIEATARLTDVRPIAGGWRLRVETALAAELHEGDSLAVDGVCLTVTSTDATSVTADVSPETARITTLGQARSGSLVNLERSLRADARLGGHFVQGHVDGLGSVDDLRPDGDSFWLAVNFPVELAPYIVRKGSIAVAGVSLTVASLEEQRFGVQIVPYTWRHTNIRSLEPGAPVNIECDILGKYVARALELAGIDRGVR